MENSKLFIASAIAISSFFSAKAQTFNKTLHQVDIDFNHYSVETYGENYYLTGTIFNKNTSDNDIHLLKLDRNGNMVWEQIIDHSRDDRGLDLCINEHDEEIAITGYILNQYNNPTMYVASYNLNGSFINDTRDVISHDDVSSGTNIIFSRASGHYFVGGSRGSNSGFGGTEPYLDHGYGIVVKFDNSLNYDSHVEFAASPDHHSSINDIVEIEGSEVYEDGLFVTGTVGKYSGSLTNDNTDVLAIRLNYTLSVVYNSSFESSMKSNIGVSAVYDRRLQEIYLLSNNGATKNPQLTTIDDLSGNILNSRSFNIQSNVIDNKGGASGFQIRKSQTDPLNNLVIAGYFKKYQIADLTDNAASWIVEVNKSGSIIDSYVLPITSDGFPSHGDGIYSTFRDPHPYVFNQEILSYGATSADYVLLSPRLLGGNYGLDLTTFFMNQALDLCFEDLSVYSFRSCETSINVNSHKPNKTFRTPQLHPKQFRSKESIYCGSGGGDDEVQPGLNRSKSSNQSIKTSLNVSPNPFNNIININLEGKNLSGKIQITNSIGKLVYESSNISGESFRKAIDLSSQAKGMFLIRVIDGEKTKMKRVIKL